MTFKSFTGFGVAALAASLLFAAPVGTLASTVDRNGGPLNPADVFPTTMEPLHPLNPAELSRTTESSLQFGFQGDGRSLVLGLPNFLIAITGQTIDWTPPSGKAATYEAKKYEVGYGVSTTDLNWGASGAPSLAVGFQLRYLEFAPVLQDSGERIASAFGDVGLSAHYRRFRIDIACLNLAGTHGNSQATQPVNQPGRAPREYNFGIAYGMPSDWLLSARLGIQETTQRDALVDMGFEKLFFKNLTFRIGSQRRYAYGDNTAAREINSSMSGGIWYRVNALGENYRYPDKDGDLFSFPTVLRMLRDIEIGGLVQLTKSIDAAASVDAANNPSSSNTSIMATIGKSL